MRQVNLARASKLPNFVAEEKAVIYTGAGKEPSKWKYKETLESEVTFVNGRLSRQHTRKDGKPLAPPTFVASGGFGIELKPLLSPGCPTKIEFESRVDNQSWYRFSSPADGCFGPLGKQGNKAARTGRFLANDHTGDIVRYEEEASFLKGSTMLQRNEIEMLDYVKIADETFLLPVSAEFRYRFNRGSPERTVIEYTKHRYFEASSNVTFQQ